MLASIGMAGAIGVKQGVNQWKQEKCYVNCTGNGTGNGTMERAMVRTMEKTNASANFTEKRLEKRLEITEKMRNETRKEVRGKSANASANATVMAKVMAKEKMREKMKKMRETRIKVEKRLKMIAVERNFLSAKEKYLRLKQECMRLKMEGKLDLKHEKMFCLAAGDLVVKWFDRIEALILNSNLNESVKDELIAKLEQEKIAFEEKLKAVNSTETPEQFRQVVKEIREEWANARKTVSEVVIEVAITKLDRTISTAEKLETKLSTIANNTLLQDYSAKVQEARNYLEEAKNELNSGNVVGAKEMIRNAIKSLKEAFRDAKLIVREVNMKGVEIRKFAKQGILNVEGSGSFKFEGSGLVVVVAKNATISYSGELVNSTFTSVNGVLTGNGRATIRGENVTVSVKGEWVRMFIRGEGTAILNGTGVYWNGTMRNSLNGSVELTVR